jgi:protein-S-isoprenylcysteine O-methyltransferase Ste14
MNLARTLFWVIVLTILSPLYLRMFLSRNQRPFLARSRWIILIRLAEFSDVFLFLAAAYRWGWNFALTPAPRAAAAVGLILGAAGAGLATWSKFRLGAFFSTSLGVKEGHEVITTGPYAWVRHPMYTGLLLVMLGGALVYNSGLALAMLLLPFCVFFFWQSALEEKLLLIQLGESYRRYRQSTGRFLPRLARW